MYIRKCTVLVILNCLISIRSNDAADGNSADPIQISKDMCKKYASSVPDSFECPFTQEELIVGNLFASRQEFPHMVIVGYKKDKDDGFGWSCSGVLISDQYALIAAHCLVKQSHRPVLIRTGITNLNDSDHLQEINITETVVHPEYNVLSSYNNIGLIKLEKKVEFNDYVRPACLYTAKNVDAKIAVNSGWGTTKVFGKFDSRLQKVVLEIYDQERCNNSYRREFGTERIKNGITYDTMICAGTKDIITIQPQTGGPLLLYHKDDDKSVKCMYDVIGIASFGKISGLAKDIPDVYTRISAYIPWIVEKVWKN